MKKLANGSRFDHITVVDLKAGEKIQKAKKGTKLWLEWARHWKKVNAFEENAKFDIRKKVENQSVESERQGRAESTDDA
jgi:hypothetical protein